MLAVVTFKAEDEQYVHRHIVNTEAIRAFCEAKLPDVVSGANLIDSRNPYVGHGRVTCKGCLTAYSQGRRD